MEFKPYKDNEYLENSYYKIPQELYNYMMKFEWNDDLTKYTEVKKNVNNSYNSKQK